MLLWIYLLLVYIYLFLLCIYLGVDFLVPEVYLCWLALVDTTKQLRTFTVWDNLFWRETTEYCQHGDGSNQKIHGRRKLYECCENWESECNTCIKALATAHILIYLTPNKCNKYKSTSSHNNALCEIRKLYYRKGGT